MASEFSLPQEVADQVGKLVMEKFEQLITGHTQHSRRKVRLEVDSVYFLSVQNYVYIHKYIYVAS